MSYFQNMAYSGSMVLRTKIDANGRIVLPADIRRRLGVGIGDELTLEVEGDVVRIRSFRQAVREAQSLYRASMSKRKKTDPVQDLLDLRAGEFWGE